MSRYGSPNYEQVTGEKVILVEGARLYLEDGRAFEFYLDGECCSSSEFTEEAFIALQELKGAVIRSIEDREGESDTPSKTAEAGEELKWHFLVITTDKGHITVDWRNSSNGYYDGTCWLSPVDPLPPWRHDAALLGRISPDAQEYE